MNHADHLAAKSSNLLVASLDTRLKRRLLLHQLLMHAPQLLTQHQYHHQLSSVIVIIIIHLLYAPLRVCNAKRSNQSLFGATSGEVIGFQVLLDSLHPCCTRESQLTCKHSNSNGTSNSLNSKYTKMVLSQKNVARTHLFVLLSLQCTAKNNCSIWFMSQ